MRNVAQTLSEAIWNYVSYYIWFYRNTWWLIAGFFFLPFLCGNLSLCSPGGWYYLAPVDFVLPAILLSQLPECWDHRHSPSCPCIILVILQQGLLYPRLVSNLLCSKDGFGLRIFLSSPPSAEITSRHTRSAWYCAGNWTKDFVHARSALYQLNHTLTSIAHAHFVSHHVPVCITCSCFFFKACS